MKLDGFDVGNDRPLFLIAGTCVIESEQMAIDTAGTLKAICDDLDIPLIYKSSFDKANRSSQASFRGPGMEEGLRILYETNPFSQACGRVCTHKCETVCASAHEGDPIAIRWLKRYAMDAFTPEQIRDIVGRPTTTATGRKIAIVGSGPAGLTAAFDLVRMGHEVTVFEGLDRPGGMPRWGIPAYRLPYERLDADIAVIEAMGVEIRCNTWIGRDISLAALREDYDAVMLALGLQLGRSTRIPGADHPRVYKAVDILRWFTDDQAFEVPRSAVVIGGGNVAIDAARVLKRLGTETVTVVYRRTEK